MPDLNDKTIKTLALVGAGLMSLATMGKVMTLGLTLASFATGMAYRVWYALPW